MVEEAIAALNRGDLPAAVKDTTTDFVFDFSRSRSPERGLYGREDIVRLQEDFGGVWESVRYEAGELIESADQIVTPITTYNLGRDGIEVQTRTAWIWRFSDGLIARVTFFQDREAALAAAGLSR